MKDKEALRLKYKEKRKSLGSRLRGEISALISELTFTFILENFPKSNIHLYLPIKKLNEVDTFKLLERLREEGVSCFTSISDFDSQKMHTVYLPKECNFAEDEKGIPVPSPTIFAKGVKLDVVIMPLLGYDNFGTRVGYGLGYYDRFLAYMEPQPFKLGLSFFPPEEKLPREDHDIKMDGCVCPKGLILF
ncbi:5-formyltetrahydrofolate cyclo-ligase [Pleomorphovibrio marinus]|uniref:5-formyltetrahydrofolate cyclo-ligase n=1 Tax=Pleomorphovibrio marinus TaxID=2164132 RepID=UPI000E0A1310|nr:5-formyltetrahydrofolate cyclo-ligase [Pleomorphovibrio marinus]